MTPEKAPAQAATEVSEVLLQGTYDSGRANMTNLQPMQTSADSWAVMQTTGDAVLVESLQGWSCTMSALSGEASIRSAPHAQRDLGLSCDQAASVRHDSPFPPVI